MNGRTERGAAPPSLIIVSDCTDVAFVEMRCGILATYLGVVGSVVRHAMIEPIVQCVHYSVSNASFLTRLVGEVSPSGAVVMVIMNSLMQRTERIVGRTAERDLIFEGTNTGAFGWLLDDFGCAECYELHDPGFIPFGGKYVHAPAVGRILAGCPLSSLGQLFDPTKIRRYRPQRSEVVHIDNFGNLKLFLNDAPGEAGRMVKVAFPSGASVNAVCWTRMMERQTGEWVLYPGSSLGLYELGQVRSAGASSLAVTVGDVATIEQVC